MATHDVERIEPYLEPLRKSVTVRCSVDRAFELFTSGIDSWWPKSKYSVSQERTRDCAVEPREGGAIYETRDVDSWWPKSKYSVSQERTRECAVEPREGGAIYETRDDGERFTWGRVKAWEPPRRFVMLWHPGREAESAQEVEVRFSEGDGETLVELEHRDWAKLGDQASKSREGYESGWDHVLGECYVKGCNSPTEG